MKTGRPGERYEEQRQFPGVSSLAYPDVFGGLHLLESLALIFALGPDTGEVGVFELLDSIVDFVKPDLFCVAGRSQLLGYLGKMFRVSVKTRPVLATLGRGNPPEGIDGAVPGKEANVIDIRDQRRGQVFIGDSGNVRDIEAQSVLAALDCNTIRQPGGPTDGAHLIRPQLKREAGGMNKVLALHQPEGIEIVAAGGVPWNMVAIFEDAPDSDAGQGRGPACAGLPHRVHVGVGRIADEGEDRSVGMDGSGEEVLVYVARIEASRNIDSPGGKTGLIEYFDPDMDEYFLGRVIVRLLVGEDHGRRPRGLGFRGHGELSRRGSYPMELQRHSARGCGSQQSAYHEYADELQLQHDGEDVSSKHD